MLIYQQTEYGLAEGLGITRNEAFALIQQYYQKLPILAAGMKRFKRFALQKGYTMSLAPFKRKRWFRDWEENQKYVEGFLTGVSDNYVLAEIGRQGVNTPIQGSAADMAKLALCYTYEYMDDMNLFDIVLLCGLIHDEILTECPEEMQDEWKELLHGFMLKAGEVIVKGGLITAETKISTEWVK